MMTWIDTLLAQTDDYEAPVSYYFWSGLAAISAAVKDKVYINRSSDRMRTYPNVYVLLLAKTGVTRKSAPISLIEQIVTEANVTRVLSGRSSIEKILDDLGTTITVEGKTPNDRKVIKDSAGFMVSGELSASIIANPQALTILTNLYDRNYNNGVWSINLKSGVKKLTKPTITFLSATNDQHMKTFFENKDMYGGFLGRTIVVSADAPKKLNPLLRDSEIYPDVSNLACYLSELSKLEGRFNIEDRVVMHYEKWYENYYGPVQRGEADVEDKTGTFSRIGDYALKVAMLLSLSESPSLEITMHHMEEAISLCEPFVEVNARAVRGIGRNTLAVQTNMVMEFLEKHDGKASRVQILNRFVGDISHEDMNFIAANLEETGFLKIEKYGSGYVYQMPDDVLNKYRRWLAAKRGGDKK